jgi:type I restriction enzyme S subunit
VQPALVRQFELLASAPNGIARLRELILMLAVQGKLVPQDPADQTAHETLKRIQDERDSLIGTGKVKTPKPTNKDGSEELPFEIPPSWEWARLSDIVRVLNGRAYSKQELLDAGPTPVLRVGNLFTSDHWYYSNLSLDPDKLCNPGDLLFAWSASFGPFIWDGPKAIFHYHIWKLDPIVPRHFDARYFHLFLREKTAELKAAGRGVSMVHLTKEKMEKIPVPWPPLAEQARIVARVDELMRLCDALEAKGRLEAEQHARLLGTLLGTLTDSRTPEELAANWQRVADHFDLLLDRPEAVDALEQTILQLAVRGLLVPQNSGDSVATSTEDNVDAQIPRHWKRSRVGDVVSMLNGYAFKSEWFLESGTRLVRNVNVGHGHLDWQQAACVSPAVADEFAQFSLAEGDVVLTLDRPIISTGLKLAVVQRNDLPCLLLQRVARLSPDANSLSSEFMLLWLRSDSFVKAIDPGRSNGVPHISTKQVAALTIDLPPLAEQAHIVARVTELRRICADLRQRLSACQTTQSHLAEALVAEVA